MNGAQTSFPFCQKETSFCLQQQIFQKDERGIANSDK
jgi:hypothetical protein